MKPVGQEAALARLCCRELRGRTCLTACHPSVRAGCPSPVQPHLLQPFGRGQPISVLLQVQERPEDLARRAGQGPADTWHRHLVTPALDPGLAWLRGSTEAGDCSSLGEPSPRLSRVRGTIPNLLCAALRVPWGPAAATAEPGTARGGLTCHAPPALLSKCG